jgi:hypothetical protein
VPGTWKLVEKIRASGMMSVPSYKKKSDSAKITCSSEKGVENGN